MSLNHEDYKQEIINYLKKKKGGISESNLYTGMDASLAAHEYLTAIDELVKEKRVICKKIERTIGFPPLHLSEATYFYREPNYVKP